MNTNFINDEYGYELTNEAKEKSWIIQVPKTITTEDIENILVDAFEASDMGRWALLDNSAPIWEDKPKGMPTSQYAVEIILNGGELKFQDVEETEDDLDWTLNLEKLLNGIQLNAEQRPDDCDLENADGNTIDCIMQYAILGEIVFG